MLSVPLQTSQLEVIRIKPNSNLKINETYDYQATNTNDMKKRPNQNTNEKEENSLSRHIIPKFNASKNPYVNEIQLALKRQGNRKKLIENSLNVLNDNSPDKIIQKERQKTVGMTLKELEGLEIFSPQIETPESIFTETPPPSKVSQKQSISNSPHFQRWSGAGSFQLYHDRFTTSQTVRKAAQAIKGQTANLWLFLLNQPTQDTVKRLTEMYHGEEHSSQVVPLFSRVDEAASVLNLENANFKIVTDLINAPEALMFKNRANVTEYYIYVSGEDEEMQALDLREGSKQKVKGVFHSLHKLLDRAQEDVLDHVRLFATDEGKVVAETKMFKFPCFLPISGKDKSSASLHRANHYSAFSLSSDECAQSMQMFLLLVDMEYGSDLSEADNIRDYKALNHSNFIASSAQAIQTLRFYTKQSFYYRLLNRTLRSLRTVDEFKVCCIPFAETYLAIKYFYQKQLHENFGLTYQPFFQKNKLPNQRNTLQQQNGPPGSLPSFFSKLTSDGTRANNPEGQSTAAELFTRQEYKQREEFSTNFLKAPKSKIGNQSTASKFAKDTQDRQRQAKGAASSLTNGSSSPQTKNMRLSQESCLYYRGTIMSSSDINTLVNSVGLFIETFGFMSASKDKNIANKFMKASSKEGKNKVLIVIHVPPLRMDQISKQFHGNQKYQRNRINIPAKMQSVDGTFHEEIVSEFDTQEAKEQHFREEDKLMEEQTNYFDHGYVDINRWDLSDPKLREEEEVLFNALNVYRVAKAEKKGLSYQVHLQYGSISQLVKRSAEQLSVDERDTLINYRYCLQFPKMIEDLGDVYIMNANYPRALEYYRNKVNRHPYDIGFKIKKAKVQLLLGDTSAAEALCYLQLQDLERLQNKAQKKHDIQLYIAHTQIADVQIASQDYLQATETLTNALTTLPDWNILKRAQALKSRGEAYFKRGMIQEAEVDLKESEYLFSNLQEELESLLKRQRRRYYCQLFTSCCCLGRSNIGITYKQIVIEVEQIRGIARSERIKINCQLLKIVRALQLIARSVNDQGQYENSIRRAQSYLNDCVTTDPSMLADVKMLSATLGICLQNEHQSIQPASKSSQMEEKQNSYASKIQEEPSRERRITKRVSAQRLVQEAINLIESNDKYDIRLNQCNQILGDIERTDCELILGTAKFVFMNEPSRPEDIEEYDPNKIQVVKEKALKSYERSLQILKYHNKPATSIQVVSVKNKIGELEFQTASYQRCQTVLFEILRQQEQLNVIHSQMAKALLLQSKVYVARGELRRALVEVSKAESCLRKAICKKQTAQYEQQLFKSNLFIEIKLYWCQIQRKLNSNQPLAQVLIPLEKEMKRSLRSSQIHPLLPDLYEELGATYFTKDYYLFRQYFNDALQYRLRQSGQYNPARVAGLCAFSHFLILASEPSELAEPRALLNEAQTVFEQVQKSHPITYMVFLTRGLLLDKQGSNEQARRQIQVALNLSQTHFDLTHITPKKIKWSLCKVLKKTGQMRDSERLMLELSNQIAVQLRTTSVSQISNNEDENIRLSVLVEQEIRTTQQGAIRNTSLEPPRLLSNQNQRNGSIGMDNVNSSTFRDDRPQHSQFYNVHTLSSHSNKNYNSQPKPFRSQAPNSKYELFPQNRNRQNYNGSTRG